jgi:hypothetical protein
VDRISEDLKEDLVVGGAAKDHSTVTAPLRHMKGKTRNEEAKRTRHILDKRNGHSIDRWRTIPNEGGDSRVGHCRTCVVPGALNANSFKCNVSSLTRVPLF